MENNKQLLKIILTGGTIDSTYDGINDTVITLEHSIIPRYLSNIKLDWIIDYKEVCMKDSRELNDEDRKNILMEIEGSVQGNILITHGTYTMPDTARYIEANIKNKNKKVILTGSMIPLDGFNMSDGGFNIGFALGSFKSVNPGIYVAMNGNLFKPSEVIKELNQGRFSSIFNK